MHDRKAGLQDPQPVHLQLLPRDGCRVKQTNSSGLHRGDRHAGRPNSRNIALWLFPS